MPNGDMTGPNGLGPKTGRKHGYCSGYDQPGRYASMFGQRRPRWGLRRNIEDGFFGRGRRRRFGRFNDV